MPTILQARSRGFVNTPAVEKMTVRALRYLKSGFPVHLRGPAGTGKTTLALHIAELRGRPILLIFGDDDLNISDLIRNKTGYSRKKVVDNYIHSVVKMEDEMRQKWVDSRLTLAAKEGFTLVYDEFNRSRPEVNNVLLSLLEEKLLVLPPSNENMEYIRAHPEFRAIFTSNPAEYHGVHATQDALMDRLVTMDIPEPDKLTQTEIMVQKIGINREDALKLISIVSDLRAKTGIQKYWGLRSILMIAKICKDHDIPIGLGNDEFRDVCTDVLLSRLGINPDRTKIKLSEVPNKKVASNKVREVYKYLQLSEGARMSEIESAMGWNRVETVNAMGVLMDKGMIKLTDDRLYVVQKQDESS